MTFLPIKSIPMVDYDRGEVNIVFIFEFVVDESFDDGGLAGGGIAEEDDLVGFFADGGAGYGHLIFLEGFAIIND